MVDWPGVPAPGRFLGRVLEENEVNYVQSTTLSNVSLKQPPPEAQLLDKLLTDIRGVAERIAGNVGNLESFNGRLLGEAKTDQQTVGPSPVPNGLLDEMRDAVSRCFVLLALLEDQIHRLSKVA